MARVARLLILAALLPAALCAGLPTGAQALQRLNVRSMALSVDTPRVRVGDMLRLNLRVHLGGRVTRLDNVTLGDVSGFDVMGDERRCVPQRATTDCIETLSLAPSTPGRFVLGPIYLDATDARTSRPTRFGSNTVAVDVLPAGGVVPGPGVVAVVAEALRDAAIALCVLFVGLVVLLVARRLPRRTRAAALADAPPAVATVAPPPEVDNRWRVMLDRLRARPSRGRVAALREILRERVGARPDETFSDLAGRGVQFEEPSSMEALRMLERAAFVDDASLPGAVVDALPALEAVAGMRRVG